MTWKRSNGPCLLPRRKIHEGFLEVNLSATRILGPGTRKKTLRAGAIATEVAGVCSRISRVLTPRGAMAHAMMGFDASMDVGSDELMNWHRVDEVRLRVGDENRVGAMGPARGPSALAAPSMESSAYETMTLAEVATWREMSSCRSCGYEGRPTHSLDNSLHVGGLPPNARIRDTSSSEARRRKRRPCRSHRSAFSTDVPPSSSAHPPPPSE